MLLNPSDPASIAPSTLHGSLAASAVKYIDLAFVQSRPQLRGGLPPRAARRVRDYIDAHLDENVSIEVLAGVAGLSMFHFARAFKQSEGLTPHGYIVQRRVRRAQELLAGTDLPLSEIALAAGFSDQSHCSRRFREHVGVTPSTYRWSMR